MKGIVFTSFGDMICEQFGIDTWDDAIFQANLESEGAYTSVGNYPVSELHKLVAALSDISQIDKESLYSSFGVYLAGIFVEKFPDFFHTSANTFELLMNVDGYIHGEVRKLYPDASLPKLEGVMDASNHMTLEYQSKNCLSHFAEGLIHGVANYYHEKVDIKRKNYPDSDGEHVLFHLTVSE